MVQVRVNHILAHPHPCPCCAATAIHGGGDILRFTVSVLDAEPQDEPPTRGAHGVPVDTKRLIDVAVMTETEANAEAILFAW